MFLPDLPDKESGDAVGLVLQEFGFEHTTEAPEWTNAVEIPGCRELEERITSRQNDIRSIYDEIERLGSRRRDLLSYRKLLYASGTELEEALRRCLEDLGGKVTPARYGQEEYVLEFDGQEYLLEVKGVGKGIALAHLRQLYDYLLKYQEETAKVCKGILFGNAWRDHRPAERNAQDKEEFPANVIERASQLQVALVPSTSFFEAFCEFLRKDTLGPKILRMMTSSSGLVDLSTIKAKNG